MTLIRAILQHRTEDSLSADDLTLVREWAIETDGADHNVFDVIERWPEFTPGTIEGGLRVGNVGVRNQGTTNWLKLEVEYGKVEYDNPLQKPIDWTWESSKIEIPAYIDAKGRPIATTAGELIGGLTRPVTLWNIRGVRNVPGVPPWVLQNYGASVNSDSVRIDGITFAPNYLQLEKMSLGNWQESKVGGRAIRYREMALEFWFNPLTWSTPVPNRGLYELHISREVLTRDEDGDPKKTRLVAKRVRCTNADGEETAGPVFLDKRGLRPREKNARVPKETLDPADIVILSFDLQKSLPYSVLVR